MTVGVQCTDSKVTADMLKSDKFTYLVDEEVTVEGLRIYG